jgi:hypothetical protein
MSAFADPGGKAPTGNGALADAYGHYNADLARGLTDLEFRIDGLAVQILNVRKTVTTLVLCQMGTFAAILADLLVRAIQ